MIPTRLSYSETTPSPLPESPFGRGLVHSQMLCFTFTEHEFIDLIAQGTSVVDRDHTQLGLTPLMIFTLSNGLSSMYKYNPIRARNVACQYSLPDPATLSPPPFTIFMDLLDAGGAEGLLLKTLEVGGREGLTALHLALTTAASPSEVVCELIRLQPEALETMGQEKHPALYYALVFRAEEGVIRCLLDMHPGPHSGVDVPDANGCLPLHVALKQRHISTAVVRLLLDRHPMSHGGTIMATFKHGWLPLHYAVASGVSADVVRLLLERHPSPDGGVCTTMTWGKGTYPYMMSTGAVNIGFRYVCPGDVLELLLQRHPNPEEVLMKTRPLPSGTGGFGRFIIHVVFRAVRGDVLDDSGQFAAALVTVCGLGVRIAQATGNNRTSLVSSLRTFSRGYSRLKFRAGDVAPRFRSLHTIPFPPEKRNEVVDDVSRHGVCYRMMGGHVGVPEPMGSVTCMAQNRAVVAWVRRQRRLWWGVTTAVVEGRRWHGGGEDALHHNNDKEEEVGGEDNDDNAAVGDNERWWGCYLKQHGR